MENKHDVYRSKDCMKKPQESSENVKMSYICKKNLKINI